MRNDSFNYLFEKKKLKQTVLLPTIAIPIVVINV